MIPGLPPFNDADLIVPQIWLGNGRAAHNQDFLKNQNIEVVFNCTKDIPFNEIMRRRYRVPVDDDLSQEEIRNMELWSFEIIYKLMQEYKQGRTILVHCAAGMQRSAAVVAMFLIAGAGMKWEDAMQFIRQRRPIAFYPSANFLQAIQGFDKTLQSMLLHT